VPCPSAWPGGEGDQGDGGGGIRIPEICLTVGISGLQVDYEAIAIGRRVRAILSRDLCLRIARW
jgi:hypothetical protein